MGVSSVRETRNHSEIMDSYIQVTDYQLPLLLPVQNLMKLLSSHWSLTDPVSITAFSDLELGSSAWGSDITCRWELFFQGKASDASSWWRR